MSNQSKILAQPIRATRRRWRYSLRTLLLATTVAAFCVGFSAAVVRWFFGHHTIAVLAGPQQRSVTIAAPNYSDSYHRRIAIEFKQGRQLVCTSGIAAPSSTKVDADDFAVVWLEAGDVAAAFSNVSSRPYDSYWHAIATFRYSTGQLFDEDDHLPNHLARAVSAQFARERPGAGPLKVLRRQPSIVREKR